MTWDTMKKQNGTAFSEREKKYRKGNEECSRREYHKQDDNSLDTDMKLKENQLIITTIT